LKGASTSTLKIRNALARQTNHGFAHHLILKKNQNKWEERTKAKNPSFLTIHDDEGKVKNTKTIVDHLFLS
jgi:hypothetical protein